MHHSKWPLLLVLLLAALGQLAHCGAALQAGELGPFGLTPEGGDLALLLQKILLEKLPPLGVLFDWFVQRVVAGAEWNPRLPSVLLGLSGVLLVHALGTRVLNRPVALIGALLFALSPVQMWYAVQAGGALLPLVLCLAAALQFYRLADGGKLWSAGTAYALCGLALSFAHAYGIVFVLSFSLLARLSRMAGERRVHLIGLAILALWCAYRWLLLDGASMALLEGSMGSIPLHDWRELYLDWLASGRALRPVLGGIASGSGIMSSLQPALAWSLHCLLFLLLMRGLLTLLRSQHFEQPLLASGAARRSASAHLIVLLLALPLCMLAASLLGGAKSVQPRELLPLLPFFLLVLAAGLTIGVGNLRQARLALSLGLLLKGDLLALALQPGAWCVDEPRADWAGAVAQLSAELDAKGKSREVYVAYADAQVLRHFDARLQPRDWRERCVQLTDALQGPEVASWAQDASLEALDALELAWERDWEQRAMSVLGIEVSPLRTSGESRSDRLPFYLLFKQHEGQDFYRRHPLLLPPILQDLSLEGQPIGDPTLDAPLPSPALLKLEQVEHYDSLVLLKLSWVK